MTEKKPYPLLTLSWVRKRAAISNLEVVAAHARGYLQPNSDVAESWLWLVDTFREDSYEALKNLSYSNRLQDKYFILLLVNLFESWFAVEKPRTALESLVLDFRESRIILGYDNMLPARIAGISELDESKLGSAAEEFQTNITVHRWLGDYALGYGKADLLTERL